MTTTNATGRTLGLTALLVAEAMNLLDAKIVAVAGPVISTDLGGDPAAIPWLGAAYTAAFGLLLITGGRLGDLVGRRRVFRLGVAGFALASPACASPRPWRCCSWPAWCKGRWPPRWCHRRSA